MSSLKTIILKLYPRLRVPRSSLLCAPWQKTRPNSKRRPFTSFCFASFFQVFWLFLCFVPRGKRVARASPHARAFAGVYAAVRGSPIPQFAGVHASSRRRSRLSHPAVRRSSPPPFAAQRSRRSRELTPPFAAQPSRHSREFTPPFAINQPTVRRRWQRRRPRLTLAHRPAAESMPAGLPLTQCPPACLWLNARRPASNSSPPIAADSSSPDCCWLMPAGRRWRGKPLATSSVSRRRPRLTHPPFAGESPPPIRGKANPPSAAASSSRGKANPAIRGSPRPTVRPEAPSSPPAPAVEWSSQPAAVVIVKPAGYGLASRPLPYWQASRPWPYIDQTGTQGLFNIVSCFRVCFRPGGLLIPWAAPWIFLGVYKVPAVEAGTRPRPRGTTCLGLLSYLLHLWPPSVCFALEAPSCVCLCVGPVGSAECPPPSLVVLLRARDAPSGRGEYMSDLCRVCLVFPPLFPYMVCFLSSFHVIMSLFGFQVCVVWLLIIWCL